MLKVSISGMNRRGTVWFLFFLGLFSLTPLLAQQQENATDVVEEVDEDSEIVERSARLKNTLARDIATSNYYELQAWLKGLNLPTSGSLGEMKRRLFNYYDLEEPEQEESSKKDKLIITITGANQTRFFELKRHDEENESYIQISGGVNVNLDDSKTGEKHNIKADAIIFNKDTSTISATGNIVYERTNSDDKIEYSLGESLTFKVKGWRGLIIDGTVVRGQELKRSLPKDIVSIERPKVEDELLEIVETQEAADDTLARDEESEEKNNFLLNNREETIKKVFFLNAETLRKGKGEVMILENGVVKTENVDNPTFSLRTQRIWLLGGDEWAMVDAPLYVGHIPIFYLPVYYYTSNAPFFNPVFGFNEAYGNLIQTTTYLIGRKENKEEDALSFLPVTNSLKNYEEKPTGLFLLKEKPADNKEVKIPKDTLKLLADYYTKLGFYGALEGDFDIEDSWAKSLSFSSGIGIYQELDENGNIAIKYDEQTNSYIAAAPKMNFLNEEVPFRYGSEFSFKAEYLEIDLDLYSDPDFKRDYEDRQENFDWVAYGFTKLKPDEDYQRYIDRIDNKSISSYQWKIKNELRPSIDVLSPYLSSINWTNIIDIQFRARENEDPSIPANYRSKNFFIPEQMILPETNLSISGTLFSTDALVNKKSDQSKEVDQRIYSLDSNAEENQQEQEKQEDVSQENSLLDKPAIIGFNSENLTTEQNYSSSIKYNASTKNSFTNKAADEKWKSINDVDNRFFWTLHKTTNSFDLKFNQIFFRGYVSNDLNTEIRASENQYFPFWEDAPKPTDKEILDVSKQSKAEIDSTFLLTINPLKEVLWLEKSKIEYQLGANIYNWAYDNQKKDFKIETIDLLNRELVNDHETTVTGDFTPIDNAGLSVSYLQFKTTFEMILPPLYRKETITPLFAITFFNWSHIWDLSIEKQYDDNPKSSAEEREWQVKPLNYKSEFKAFDEQLVLRNDFVFDFKKDTPTKNDFSFQAWWFSGKFNAGYQDKYEWKVSESTNELNWVKVDKAFIPREVALEFDFKSEQIYLWKNRLTFVLNYNLAWEQNLVRYNNKSSLTSNFGFAFYLYDFLDLHINLSSSNEYLYLYYPWTRELFGITDDYNFFEDLLRSFNIFNEQDRRDSLFKMSSLKFFLVHHLKDWDFILEYVGLPIRENNEERWDTKLGFYVKWLPVPLLQRRIIYEDKDDNWTSDLGR